MNRIINSLRKMLPHAAAIVCIFGFVYVALQQYIRLSANEIPLQYAENARARLEKGATPEQAISGVELTGTEHSLAPFLMIAGKDGNTIVSTSALCATRSIPKGVLNVAWQNGENRRTWQPEHDLRNAIVALPWSINGKEGFVIGGRSLRETEQREQFLLAQIVGGLIVTLLVTFLCTVAVQSSKKEPLTAS